MGVILGLVGLVVLAFVVATISGVFSGVRAYRSELEDPDAIHRMGVESLTSGNVKAAVLRFEHASKMGHAGSAFNLGLMFGNGMGFQKDMSEAFKWFKLAADRGLAQGHLNVGGLYLHGDGVGKNLTKAYHHIRIAADEGLEPAIALTEEFEATLEDDWSFVAQIDEKEWRERRRAVFLHLRSIGTVEALERAARGGDRETALNLALMHMTGDRVAKDPALAYEWTRNAVKIGNLKALLVADMMRPEADPTLAKLQPSFDLYDRAASGDQQSRYEIGRRFLDGVGVKKNPAAAAQWFLMSYKFPPSRQALESLDRAHWPEEFRDEELPAA